MADERPNFVHILTDDQTVDSLASMPFTQIVLGVEGTTFTNHHAVQPLCCPSRASFLTGQYPHNHGVLNNLPPFGYDRLNFKRTIYTALDRAGYRTGWIGKVLNDPDSRGLDPEPGFDEWLVPLGVSELNMRDYRLSATTGPPSTSPTPSRTTTCGPGRGRSSARDRRPRSCSPCR